MRHIITIQLARTMRQCYHNTWKNRSMLYIGDAVGLGLTFVLPYFRMEKNATATPFSLQLPIHEPHMALPYTGATRHPSPFPHSFVLLSPSPLSLCVFVSLRAIPHARTCGSRLSLSHLVLVLVAIVHALIHAC